MYAWSGVEIFFVISGFVIPYGLLGTKFNIGNYGGFLKKRLIRIEPAYLLSILVILLLNYISSLITVYQGNTFALSPLRLALHVGYLVDIFNEEWLNPAYWTLAVELQYYLIIGIFLAVWNLRNKYLTTATVILFLMMSFLHIETIRFVRYTDIFTIGILVAFYKRYWITKPVFLTATLITSAIIYMHHDAVIFTVTLGCALTIAFFDNFSNNRMLLFLGNISYSLYLLHIPIGGRVVNLAKRFDLSEFSKALVVIFAVAISIFASWLFYLAVEKPSHKWSKKIKLKTD
jgi:peptidoglycan/LPS O-acetylase OafA/YrhL